MQIDTQPLQVNARRINVPRVIYGAGDSAVRLLIFILNRTRLPDPNPECTRRRLECGWKEAQFT